MSIAVPYTTLLNFYGTTYDITPTGLDVFQSGDLAVFACTWNSRTANVTISDDQGHTWQAAAPVTRGAGSDDISSQIWYAYNVTGNFTATATLTSTALFFGYLIRVTGAGATFNPLNAVSENAATSLSAAAYDFACGSVTPATAGAIVIAVTRHTANSTPDTANAMTWIYGESINAIATFRYEVQTSPAAQVGTVSFGESIGICGALAVFLETPVPLAWVDIPNWHAQEWINASRYPGGAARCLCDPWTTESGVMIKARLVSLLADGTVDAVVGMSAEITATTPTDATFSVTLTGNKQHKLQLTSDTPNTDLWCAPDAKVTA